MSEARARPFDVVIAGGSFAGLALALALSRVEGGGLDVAIVERSPLASPPPSRDPRAFALAGGSIALLETIGIWPRISEAAQPVSGVDITDSSLADAMRPVLLSYDTKGEARPHMAVVEADILRTALIEAVLAEPGVTVLSPVEVAALERTSGALALRCSDGSSCAGRLVVAADGSHSPVRTLAGIGVVTGSYGQRGIAVIVRHDETDHGGRAVQHFLPSGPFALLPLPGRRSCITWSEGDASAARIMALDDEAFLAEAQERAGWRLGRLALDGPRSAWPLSSRLARALVGERIALVGDAARSVHPIAGQGVNLGFRDVAALAECIIDGVRLGLDPADITVLERYERWRRADGVQATAAFTALNALFSNDWTVLRALRDAGLGLVDRLPGLKQLLVSEAAGLTGEVPRLLQGRAL